MSLCHYKYTAFKPAAGLRQERAFQLPANNRRSITTARLASRRTSYSNEEVQDCLPSGLKAAVHLLAAAAVITAPLDALAAQAVQEVLVGPARAVDGDTLEVGGTRVRLFGVDAPEKAQSCKNAAGAEYPCGQQVAEALKTKIGSNSVQCTVRNKDMYGRSVASCSIADRANTDVGDWLVKEGYAVAYRQYSKDYIADEDQARAGHKGIWQGEFQIPSEWRKEHKRGGNSTSGPALSAPLSQQLQAAIAAAPSPSASQTVPPDPKCAIKGNIGAKKEKIYHMPGGRFYDNVKIDTSAGEKWFCSVKEAEAAGWRAASS